MDEKRTCATCVNLMMSDMKPPCWTCTHLHPHGLNCTDNYEAVKK